jgi:hypothetical protein
LVDLWVVRYAHKSGVGYRSGAGVLGNLYADGRKVDGRCLMASDSLYVRRDAPVPDDEWVDESEACLGRHHVYVPVERSALTCDDCGGHDFILTVPTVEHRE